LLREGERIHLNPHCRRETKYSTTMHTQAVDKAQICAILCGIRSKAFAATKTAIRIDEFAKNIPPFTPDETAPTH